MKILYCHIILDIEILIALLDNLICMDFINPENNPPKIYSVTQISLKENQKILLMSKENLNKINKINKIYLLIMSIQQEISLMHLILIKKLKLIILSNNQIQIIILSIIIEVT